MSVGPADAAPPSPPPPPPPPPPRVDQPPQPAAPEQAGSAAQASAPAAPAAPQSAPPIRDGWEDPKPKPMDLSGGVGPAPLSADQYMALQAGGAGEAAPGVTAAAPPPSNPNGPPTYQSGDANGFNYTVGGQSPPVAGGNALDQSKQLAVQGALEAQAVPSALTRNAPLRVPTDDQVRGELNTLAPIPPDNGPNTTTTTYTSNIPNASAGDAFNHFVQDPNAVFNAAGMEIRPPTNQLQDGGRYMLELKQPPAWLPIQVSVDPATRTVGITTMDGHPLRGYQSFTFQDDGNGGANVVQDARFQLNAWPTEKLQDQLQIVQNQHHAWQDAHREMYQHFNP